MFCGRIIFLFFGVLMNKSRLCLLLTAIFTCVIGIGQAKGSQLFLSQSQCLQIDVCRAGLPEHPEVLEAFDRLIQALDNEKVVESDYRKILESVSFAAEKHRGQTRKNVEKPPYILHPLRVACHLVYMGNVIDRDVLVAALLHDTIEDAETTFEEISYQFGSRVACLVHEMSNDLSLPSHVQKEEQVLKASYKSLEAALIMLADKLDNLSDLQVAPPAEWERERIDRYFRHAKAVIDNLPSANGSLKASVDAMIINYWHYRDMP